jgi:hypothetical protein
MPIGFNLANYKHYRGTAKFKICPGCGSKYHIRYKLFRGELVAYRVFRMPTGRDSLREKTRDYLGNFPDTLIANKFNCSRERIRQLRESRGIPKYGDGQVCPSVRTEDFVAEVMAYASTHTKSEVYEKYGKVGGQVLMENNFDSKPTQVSRNANRPEVIIPEDEFRAAYNLSGENVKRTAPRLGISEATAYTIARWYNIPIRRKISVVESQFLPVKEYVDEHHVSVKKACEDLGYKHCTFYAFLRRHQIKLKEFVESSYGALAKKLP